MAARLARLQASAPLFSALGDGTRLRLVDRLCSGGPQSIARLTAGSSVTRQAITKHLRVLGDADLVPGAEIEPVIERMLADPAVQELHVHNARAGCFNCRIVRGLGE